MSDSPIGKPGYTGNPGGRPKMSEAHKIAFKELSDLAVENLRAILNGSDSTAKSSDRIKAAEVVLDRHLGKPVQAIEAEITDLRPIVFDAALGGIVKPDAPNR